MVKNEYITEVKFLLRQMKLLDNLKEAIQTLTDGGNVMPVCSELTEGYIMLIEKISGDDNEWLSWWLWESKQGKENNKILINKIGYFIKTPEDVWNLIHNNLDKLENDLQ